MNDFDIKDYVQKKFDEALKKYNGYNPNMMKCFNSDKALLKRYTLYLDELRKNSNKKEVKPVERIMCILKGFDCADKVPKCEFCGNIKSFDNFEKGYLFTCGSSKCGAKYRAKQEKERYGGVYRFQSEEFKNKSKNTMMEKYGVDNAAKVDEFKKKQENTLKERYGVINPGQMENHGEKIRESYKNKSEDELKKINEDREKTCLEKYGVKNVSQLDWVKELKTNTNISNWGVKCVFESEEIKDKIKKYWNDNYNVDNPSQLHEVAVKKSMTTMNKTFTFPSGNIVSVNGSEPVFLSLLIDLGFDENDIICQDKIIEYNYENKIRKWIVDIYIKSMNSLIDVKSIYMMTHRRISDKIKILEGVNQGYDSFIVVHHKDSLFRLDPTKEINDTWILSSFYNGCTEKIIDEILNLFEKYEFKILLNKKTIK